MLKLKKMNKLGTVLFGVLLFISCILLLCRYGNNEVVTRNKAEALLKEANHRALVVAKKISQGYSRTSSLLLEEENSPEYIRAIQHIFPTSSPNQFNLSFYYVDEDVCNQLVKIIGKDSIVRNVSPCDQPALFLTYYNDLSPIDSICREGECYCKNNTVYLPFLDYPCQYQISKGGCFKNSDCKSGQYCAFSGKSDKVAPEKGTCTAKKNPEKIRISIPKSNEKITFYRGPKMTYWSIYNYCSSHSKVPVSLEDLKCSAEDGCKDSTYTKIGRFWVTDLDSDTKAYNLMRNNKNSIDVNPFNAEINVLCKDIESDK